MTDVELAEELTARAKAAGDAAGLYLESAFPVLDRDGALARPPQLIVRYRVGDRAFLEPVDVAAVEAADAEVALLEEMLDVDEVEQLRKDAAEGPLGELERGGA